MNCLKSLADSIANQPSIEGDFVECGVARGGSAALLAAAMPPGRQIWLFDSFQGLPPPTEKDHILASRWTGHSKVSIEEVQKFMAEVPIDPATFTIRPGWFKDTFIEPLPSKVSFLHCDADWYDSVMLVLETFYPRMSQGGCVVLDDFGCWRGCRVAFYDFCFKHQIYPLLCRGYASQAYWIVGNESCAPGLNIPQTNP